MNQIKRRSLHTSPLRLVTIAVGFCRVALLRDGLSIHLQFIDRPSTKYEEPLLAGKQCMEVTFYGAANDVTGSCFLVNTGTARLLVDCGMFQGSERLERLNYIPKNLGAEKLAAVLLTHGHLDHCGRLPLLYKAGFRGPIYATPATIDIATLILLDAAHIQEEDARRENKKRQTNQSKAQPLFTERDVTSVKDLFKPIDYNHWFDLAPDLKAQFVEAGHILGSSSIELVVTGPAHRHAVFSGDLGQWDVPIMRDPAVIQTSDIVFMESTYGDREHKDLASTLAEFENIILSAWKNKGKVLIPTFAVGRTQQILYHLAAMFRNGAVPPMDVYLDSPMAIAATEIYGKHGQVLDSDAGFYGAARLKKELPSLKTCVTVEESKALNNAETPCVILAGAGMCNAGRIMHHLRHGLGDANTYVVICGYQVKGSTGRQLLEGAKMVKIFGESIAVRAHVYGIGGFSAHAGQTGLLRWLARMAAHKPRVVLVHGEPHSQSELAFKIQEQYGITAEVPKLNDTVQI
jgi:metallo-beta-lactamase family protein